MTPLIEILLAVACYYPDMSDPLRGPVEMLEGDYDKLREVLKEAIKDGYVRRGNGIDEERYALMRKGRHALFEGLKDA